MVVRFCKMYLMWKDNNFCSVQGPSSNLVQHCYILSEVRTYDKISHLRKFWPMTWATSSCERNPCLLNDDLGENAHTAHAIVGAILSNQGDQDLDYQFVISLSCRTRGVSFLTLQWESSQNQSHKVITNKQSTLVNVVAKGPWLKFGHVKRA